MLDVAVSIVSYVRFGAKEAMEMTQEGSSDEETSDCGVVKEKIRGDLKRFINREAQRRPLIMRVILEI